MKFPPQANIALGVIIIIGAILRLYNLTAVSLWHDEAFSALLIRYPFGEMMSRIALDVHPPLYYWILRLWDALFGDGLFSLRAFSAFFGILTVYFAYLFMKDAFKSERLGLISAALIAFNPFQIQYATEARMYTLGTFLIVLSSWLLVKALEQKNISDFKKIGWFADADSDKNSLIKKTASAAKKYKWWIFYGATAAAAIYTHYYLIFSAAGQAAFVLILAVKNYNLSAELGASKNITKWIKSEIVRGAILAYAFVFILFLPWLRIFIKQLSQVEENYWIPKMDIYSIPNTLWTMLAGGNIYLERNLLIFVFAFFFAVFILAVRREKNDYKYLVALSFAVPFFLAIALSFKRSLYLDRYFVFAGIFYLIIFALFINSMQKQTTQKILITVFIIANIAFFVRNWQNIAPTGKPGMEAASNYIFSNSKQDDKVYVGSSFIFFTYKYYAYQNYFSDMAFSPGDLKLEDGIANHRIYPAYATPLLYTPGIKNLGELPHFSGTALLANSDLLQDFNRNTNKTDTIWLLWTTGFGSSKPEVPENWIQIDEAGFEDVLGYRGWIVVTKYQVQ